MCTGAVKISDFHYTIITAKRIHDNDTVTISIGILRKINKMQQISLYLCVLCVLSLSCYRTKRTITQYRNI